MAQILIVDDDEDLAEVLTVVLEALGHDVRLGLLDRALAERLPPVPRPSFAPAPPGKDVI